MKFTFEDLFQKPYFFQKDLFHINPFVSSHISHIQRIEEYPFYFFKTLMPEPEKDYGHGLVESGLNYGCGASFKNPAESMSKSVFEAFERKFSKVYNKHVLITGSYHDLKRRAVDPERFSLISKDEQKKRKLHYVPYTQKLKLSWKECFKVSEDKIEPVLIPASLVFSRFSWKNKRERFIPNLSPGLSAHINYRSSFLSGLLEIIERDAFMITWLHKMTCPKISIKTKELQDAEDVFEHLTGLGFKIHFINITTDTDIPVILTAIENHSLDWRGTVVFGLGCSLDPYKALKKSFLEALLGMTNYLHFDYVKKEICVHTEAVSKKAGLDNEKYFSKTRFLLNKNSYISIKDIPGYALHDAGKDLDYLITHLNNKDLETFFVDLTPDQLKNNSAFCLTRAFITGMQPMLYETDCWRFSNRRAFTAKSQMGKSHKKVKGFNDLFLFPHPFAVM